MPDSSYLATGTGGQKIRLYPEKRLVVVNRVDTGKGLRRATWWYWGKSVNNSDVSELVRRLETAIPGVLGG